MVKFAREASTGNILEKPVISAPILSSIPFTPTNTIVMINKSDRNKLEGWGFKVKWKRDNVSDTEEKNLRGRAAVSSSTSMQTEMKEEHETLYTHSYLIYKTEL